MKHERKIDKARLMFFTDAILAIIMTILVLDIKVPEVNANDSNELFNQLLKVIPHVIGFAISFAFIVVLWYSHHSLMDSLVSANNKFAALNFFFVGTTATLPFTTGLAATYPTQPIAIASLAGNMFVMSVFLAGLHIYSQNNGLRNPEYFSARFQKIKTRLGVIGTIMELLAVFVAFISPTVAIILMIAVPVMHSLPIKEK